ncbi:MAG: hypothetical protein JNK32_02775 [Anaerolineales bacterium]|nr:hypothetical protein [Anaerolineales bacterium]
METITASVLLISLLTIFGVDASRKRQEFLEKKSSGFWQRNSKGHRSGTQTTA